MRGLISCSRYNTSFGDGAVATSDAGVCGVWLPTDCAIDSLRLRESEKSAVAASQLEQYFSGILRQFDLDVDLSGMPLFSRMILERLLMLPYGDVTTYGRLAREAGRPNSARAVGRAMAANPVPVIVPCHRVVAADGRLTGYSGAGGLVTKKLILMMEGHTFQGDGKLQFYCGY